MRHIALRLLNIGLNVIKKRGSSILEVIPGLGPKRRRDLLTHFGGIQGVLKASEKDLTLVPGLGEVMARTIYKVLHE